MKGAFKKDSYEEAAKWQLKELLAFRRELLDSTDIPEPIKKAMVKTVEFQIRGFHFSNDKTYTHLCGSLQIPDKKVKSHHSFEGFMVQFHNTDRKERAQDRGIPNDELKDYLEKATAIWQEHKKSNVFGGPPKKIKEEPTSGDEDETSPLKKKARKSSDDDDASGDDDDSGTGDEEDFFDTLDDAIDAKTDPKDPANRPATEELWDAKSFAGEDKKAYGMRMKQVCDDKKTAANVMKHVHKKAFEREIIKFMEYVEKEGLRIVKLEPRDSKRWTKTAVYKKFEKEFLDSLPYNDEIDHWTKSFTKDFKLEASSA